MDESNIRITPHSKVSVRTIRELFRGFTITIKNTKGDAERRKIAECFGETLSSVLMRDVSMLATGQYYMSVAIVNKAVSDHTATIDDYFVLTRVHTYRRKIIFSSEEPLATWPSEGLMAKLFLFT